MAYKDAVLVAVSLLAAACMPLNPEENGIGRYEVTVTGGVDTTLAGPAVHYAGNQVEGFKYVIHLRTAGATPVGIFLWTAEQPRKGVYQVVNKNAVELRGNEMSAYVNLGDYTFFGDSGEMRVTSAQPLRGTFAFRAITLQIGTDNATVTGSFEFD